MELRDKNGLTEAEFLAGYNADKYPKPSLTADVAVFARDGETLRLLLIRRGGHPYLGCLALPGGFANKNEPIEQTAARELEEETGITGVPLTLFGVFSKPGRDPRGWVVTVAFAAVVEAGSVTAQAADDAADAQWYDVAVDGGTITLTSGGETVTLRDGVELGKRRIAFDHSEEVTAAIKSVLDR